MSHRNSITPREAYLVQIVRDFVVQVSRLYETPNLPLLEESVEISSYLHAYEFLRIGMEDLEQEQMRILNLNGKNRLVSAQTIYQGSVYSVEVRIAEIFRPAIQCNAVGIIVAHNHPSGDPTPSMDDILLTRELVKAGKLLGIEVMDHLIIGKDSFVSLKERGLGFHFLG